MKFIKEYVKQTKAVLGAISTKDVEKVITRLALLRRLKGRLFILGVGGSAANASHAVNDFRKLCNIDAYAPTDNVSELTARINDDGWNTCFLNYLKVSNFDYNDALLVLSVGGGSSVTSSNISEALFYARSKKATILGIIGSVSGYTARFADAYILVPPLYQESKTAHTEGLSAVIWHLIVNHPLLRPRRG